MNSTSLIESTIFLNNSNRTIIESWFIPFDIILIVVTTLTIILSILFLSIIIFDKTCHTVPMMLVANSCLSEMILGYAILSMRIFSLENDLKQIQFQDSLCIFRGYFGSACGAVFNWSYFIQAMYRYITAVYPNRLFWQSAGFQVFLICSTWIFGYVSSILHIVIGDISYNADNQICQIPLRFSFSILYATLLSYVVPISLIGLVYFKLVRYVHKMSKRVMPANILSRAQRELKMVQRIIILIIILMVLCLPYALFTILSFFTDPPRYYFRIVYVFFDPSLALVLLALYRFTEPLKTAMRKIINTRPNRIAAAVIA